MSQGALREDPRRAPRQGPRRAPRQGPRRVRLKAPRRFRNRLIDNIPLSVLKILMTESLDLQNDRFDLQIQDLRIARSRKWRIWASWVLKIEMTESPDLQNERFDLAEMEIDLWRWESILLRSLKSRIRWSSDPQMPDFATSDIILRWKSTLGDGDRSSSCLENLRFRDPQILRSLIFPDLMSPGDGNRPSRLEIDPPGLSNLRFWDPQILKSLIWPPPDLLYVQKSVMTGSSDP